MEKEKVFDKQHAKWLDIAANVHLEDGSKQVCCLDQTPRVQHVSKMYVV